MRSHTPELRELMFPNIAVAEKVLAGLDLSYEDRKWNARIFRRFPPRQAKKLAQEYQERHIFENRRSANLYLLEQDERRKQSRIPINAGDYELQQLAKHHAAEMRFTGNHFTDITERLVFLWKRAQTLGVNPPSPDNPAITITGALNRLYDEHWWLRQLRHANARELEAEALHLGLVHKLAGLYVSEDTLERYRQQKHRNRRLLSRMIAQNEEGQLFTVEELASRGVSNPKNRRNELMARIAGFERIADELGYAGIFLTLTCPSRMHARQAKSGDPNPKYDGTLPPKGQKYLCQQWAKIRAKLDRKNIRIFGIRIAEPHQDGTPHWHLLVFVQPEHMEALKAIFQHYALEVDGDEDGAKQHRFKWELIDKAKGSAIAYVAKYVSKNIDGHALMEVEDRMDAASAAERVTAWASTWGIRQFQQFGGVPVGLWRELRRASEEIPDGVLKDAFEAADQGNWAQFLQVLGGVTPRRKDLPIQIAKVASDEVGQYGDPIEEKIIGVKSDEYVLRTRIHSWRFMLLSANGVTVGMTIPAAAQPTDARTDARMRARADGTAAKPPLEFCQ